MSNEFNNNQPEEMNNSNQSPLNTNTEPTQNVQGSQNQGSVQSENTSYSYTGNGIIQDYSQGNYSTFNQGNDQTGGQNFNQAYGQNYGQSAYGTGTPNGNYDTSYSDSGVAKKKEPKARKKRRFAPAAKLVAAALVFGLVAGGAFQAYYMLAWPASEKISTTDNNIKVAEVSSTDKDSTISTDTGSSGTVVSDVSGVVASVMPSIVAINSTITTTTTDFFGRQYEQQGEGSGSGIIIAQNGSNLLVVTNNHVIEGATSIQIVFADETTATAAVKGSDANADLAVLSIDMSQLSKDTASKIKVATLGSSDDMVPGDMVIAIGNALGYGQSVTVGYVSAVNREVTIDDQTMTLLQTDAAINPGNSGGALLNIKGEVIGINSVKFASAEVEGMGYAIPISTALPMINELMNRETVAAGEQGYLGIDTSTAQEVTDAYAQRFNMPIGVYVNDVVKGSPAEKAGLMQGDIITGLDGSKIETIDDLKSALSYKKAGTTVDLTIQVLSGGSYSEKVLKVTLGEKQ